MLQRSLSRQGYVINSGTHTVCQQCLLLRRTHHCVNHSVARYCKRAACVAKGDIGGTELLSKRDGLMARLVSTVNHNE